MLIKESNGTTFTAALDAFGKSRAQLDRTLHTLACSAVWLAVEHGRPDWLNSLNTKLNQSQKDYMKAWLSPFAKVPIFTAVKWINFSTQKGGYIVIPGIDRKAAIPLEKIEEVEGDMQYFMLHAKVGRVARDQVWVDALEGRIISLANYLHKMKEDEGNDVPQSLIVAADGLKQLAIAEVKRIKETAIPEARLVSSGPVEAPQVEAPATETEAAPAEVSRRRRGKVA